MLMRRAKSIRHHGQQRFLDIQTVQRRYVRSITYKERPEHLVLLLYSVRPCLHSLLDPKPFDQGPLLGDRGTDVIRVAEVFEGRCYSPLKFSTSRGQDSIHNERKNYGRFEVPVRFYLGEHMKFFVSISRI